MDAAPQQPQPDSELSEEQLKLIEQRRQEAIRKRLARQAAIAGPKFSRPSSTPTVELPGVLMNVTPMKKTINIEKERVTAPLPSLEIIRQHAKKSASKSAPAPVTPKQMSMFNYTIVDADMLNTETEDGRYGYNTEDVKPGTSDLELTPSVLPDAPTSRSPANLTWETFMKGTTKVLRGHNRGTGTYTSVKRMKVEDSHAPSAPEPKPKREPLTPRINSNEEDISKSSILRPAFPFLLSSRSSVPLPYDCIALDADDAQFAKHVMTIKDAGKVTLGFVWTSGATNFRRGKVVSASGKIKYDDDAVNIDEKLAGVAFMVDDAPVALYMDLAIPSGPGKPTLDCKWRFLLDVVQAPTPEKIVFGSQRCMRTLFLSQGEWTMPLGFFDPLVAAWVERPEQDSWEFFDLVNKYLNIEDESPTSSNHALLSRDVSLCRQLASHLKERLTALQLTKGFSFEMEVVPVLARMEMCGIAFSHESIRQYRATLATRMDDLAQQATQFLGHPILLSSNDQVSKALFQELKLKSGSTSTNKRNLRSLQDQHPIVPIILEYRKIFKATSSYIDGMEKYKKSSDGRVHARWMQVHTGTGRLSSVSPNMQAIPKGELLVAIEQEEREADEDMTEQPPEFDLTSSGHLSVNVRNTFVAPPGFSLLAVDYSQIEMRCLAHVTRDANLVKFFQSDTDIHKLVGSRCFGKPIEEISKKEREYAKGIVYGILYGMGAPSLARTLKISVPEGQQFIRSYLQGFPAVDKFIKDTKEHAKKTQEVRTLFGRRRVLSHILSGDRDAVGLAQRQAVNSVIQGTAADIVKMAMLKIDEARRANPAYHRCKMLLQIHDELVFEVDDTCKDDFIRTVLDCTELVMDDFAVPLQVTVNVGPQWGNMTAYEIDRKRDQTAPPQPTANNALAANTHEVTIGSTVDMHSNINEESSDSEVEIPFQFKLGRFAQAGNGQDTASREPTGELPSLDLGSDDDLFMP